MRALGLSVSCIGSNGLKQFPAAGIRDYLRPFSILYRIEWVETRAGKGHGGLIKLFQYPVSDRMG